ncbi:MAG: PQQ-binding-like beta-propeller repeat protein [Planctomycetota bacterium]
MHRVSFSTVSFVAVAALVLLLLPSTTSGDDSPHWPSFRGAAARGTTAGKAAPVKWNVEKNVNVAWKAKIPGLGLSSPAIWGKQLFVTTAVSKGGNEKLKHGLYGDIRPVADSSEHSWGLICLDKVTGKKLWEKTAHRGVPKIKRHPKASHANSSPATNGKYVVAFFGSEGLYAYKMNGDLAWKKDLGVLDAGYYVVPAAQWEYGSSPIIFENKLIVQCDIQSGGFVAAFDVENGNELWRTPRKDVPTWSTPAVHVGKKGRQVILNGFRHLGAYDLDSGKELWKLSGGGDIPVPTPVFGHGLVYLTNAHGRLRPIYAIDPETASGDISIQPSEKNNAHIRWWKPRRGNYMQTPILLGDLLYCCGDSGVLGCYDAKTGDEKFLKRIARSGFTASPVASGGHLYFTSEDGDVHVLKAGAVFEEVAVNSLGEPSLASPAVSEGRLYFRTRHHIISVGK